MRTTLSTGTPAILVRPDGEPARGVVLLPDVGGLRELFDDMCEQLARDHNWAVCAPEPFPGKEDTPMGPERLALIPTNDDDRFLGDVTAAAELLAHVVEQFTQATDVGEQDDAARGFAVGAYEDRGRTGRQSRAHGAVLTDRDVREAGKPVADSARSHRADTADGVEFVSGRRQHLR